MRINISNKEKIEQELGKVQKNAKVRTIEYQDIITAANEAGDKLSHLLPKKEWVGLVVSADPQAQHFPNAYKFTPESTQFILERGDRDWFLVDVYRERCHDRLDKYVFRGLSTKAEAIVAFVNKPF